MGSNNAYGGEDEINVLITGFGPFKQEYPHNPSWEIASRLPAVLPSLRAKQPSTIKPPFIPRVNLHVHPEPIHVAYKTVRELVPKLWARNFADASSSSSTDTPAPTTAETPSEDLASPEHEGQNEEKEQEKKPKYDFAIHIGMAGPQPRWAIERLAHRDGYALRDVDGEFLRDKNNQLRDDWVWKGCPVELRTELDLDVILKKWRGYAPAEFQSSGNSDGGKEGESKKEAGKGGNGAKGGKGGNSAREGNGNGNGTGNGSSGGAKWYGNDIKGAKGDKLVISEDPGRYLCDFIYYSSLAELYKHKAERKVVFLHVPCEMGRDGEYVRIGQELVLGLVRSVAEWLVDEKKRRGGSR